MAFEIITDAASNLGMKIAKENNITIIPFSYFSNEKEYFCDDTEAFDDNAYYESIRKGKKITTSQINPARYMEYMEPMLKAGRDILFIGLSSGVSGSFASAQIAKKELLEKYPRRSIVLVDSLGASLGEGLLVLRAAKCRSNGMDIDETAKRIKFFRDRMYQVFIVDDLIHLRRTGRLSNFSAIMGSVLSIKPLLKGNDEGKIVAFNKIRGRRQAIKTMAEKYGALVKNPNKQLVGISHANCEADAKYLAQLIKQKFVPSDILIVKHEPVTGSHIGPGALALYFEGDAGVRLK
ncbi:MAG: DegV family protein [Clostridia bacterium]|nr:DegV family protein [Clostridia bacterium]